MPSSSTDVLNFVKRSCHCTALSQILIHNRLLCSQFSSCAVGYNRLFFVRRVSLSGVAGGFCSLAAWTWTGSDLQDSRCRPCTRHKAAPQSAKTRHQNFGPKALTTTYQGFWKIHGTWQLHRASQNRPFHIEAIKLERKCSRF